MRESDATGRLLFSVCGQRIAIVRTADRWLAGIVGPDGTSRPAGFVVPGFLAEDELGVYLADLFHESARPGEEVYRVGQEPERPARSSADPDMTRRNSS